MWVPSFILHRRMQLCELPCVNARGELLPNYDLRYYDHSNFNLVFSKDSLWCELPYDCYLHVLKYFEAPYPFSSGAVRWTEDIVTKYHTPTNFICTNKSIEIRSGDRITWVQIPDEPDVFVIDPKLIRAQRREQKTKSRIVKNKTTRIQHRTKDYKRQLNQANRKKH